MKLSALAITCLVITGCQTTQQPIISQQSVTAPVIPKVQIPDWFQKLPTNDVSMFSIGTALSPDLQFSFDMAVMNAKASLADRIQSKINSQTKTFQSQVGSNENLSTRQEMEKAVKNNVVNVDLAGYKILKNETVKENHLYRTYVMLEYNMESAVNASQTIHIKRSADNSIGSQSEKAFKELDSLSKN